MKKSCYYVLTLLLALPFLGSAQSLSNSYLDCEGFSAVFSGNVRPDIYFPYPNTTISCSGVSHKLIGDGVKGAQFQLQKKGANGVFTTIHTVDTNDGFMTYTGLAPGTYRARMFRRNENSSQPLYSQANPCGQVFGFTYAGNATSYLGPEIEIGTPSVSFAISPLPTGVPPKICNSVIDNVNETLSLDGSLSFGERAYQIAVFKNNLTTGVEAAYASTGWVNGKIGTFNLKSLNMVYEPGYAYTVQVALSQLPCTGWVDQVKYFIVDGSCRTLEETDPVSLYPNPAEDVLHIDGLDAWETDKVDVVLSDMLGRQVLSTTLTAPFEPISVANLSCGQYVVNIQSGSRKLTRKITVAR